MTYKDMIENEFISIDEPYAMPFYVHCENEEEQDMIDANATRYETNILERKENGEIENVGKLGGRALLAAWTHVYYGLIKKLLYENYQQTLCLYTKDGVKAFDMHEALWHLNEIVEQIISENWVSYKGDK